MSDLVKRNGSDLHLTGDTVPYFRIQGSIIPASETIYKEEDLIYVTNLDGPLKHLENKWHFKQIKNTTEVSFHVDFELKNHFLNIIMTKSFQFGLDKIADAFQKRAESLFRNV